MQLTGYQLQQTESIVTNDVHTTRFHAHTTFLPRFTSDCPIKSLTLTPSDITAIIIGKISSHYTIFYAHYPIFSPIFFRYRGVGHRKQISGSVRPASDYHIYLFVHIELIYLEVFCLIFSSNINTIKRY